MVKYLDIPIQHISDHVLKLMGRKTSKKDITDKIEKLRNKIPNIVIRTTFIVGFPQETQEDFEEILEFLQEYKLDKVGVFKYSREEDTPASKMDGQIDESIKEEREEKLMLSQEKISNNINKLKVDKKYDILIEEYDGEFYKGRNFEMAPDIDGNVFLESPKKLEIGEFVKVKIIKNMDYDLIGVVEDESCK